MSYRRLAGSTRFWAVYLVYTLISVAMVVAATLRGTIMVGAPVFLLVVIVGAVGALVAARRDRTASAGLAVGDLTVLILPWLVVA